MPDAKDDAEDVEEDEAEPSSEEEIPSEPSVASSPEPVSRKSKGKTNRFSSSAPPSSSPTPGYTTPKSAVGAFGKPLDKSERAKKFTEANKNRYSWLLDVRDKEGHRPGQENYDPRTLYIPPSAWKSFTAFEKQYWYCRTYLAANLREVKQNLWDTILFFQKGKFFELYENDATIGHQQFDLKLTDRVNMRWSNDEYC
jgi:DNA mismatch repair protein MSH6